MVATVTEGWQFSLRLFLCLDYLFFFAVLSLSSPFMLSFLV